MNLSTWLKKIGSIEPSTIHLGLERVKKVADRLKISPTCPVMIVGGTNGKGSTVAALASIYRAAGFNTGAFTSPILFKHNEEVRINGECADDDAFCDAFARIEVARGDIPLTPFEFHALAAFLIFQQSPLDVWLIEVGLGGRLDVTNILDADVAITTSIGIDHVQWLGLTREHIGREKAGIYRRGKPAISGDPNPPESLFVHAQEIGATFLCQQADFMFHEHDETWSWSYGNVHYDYLPRSQLLTQNLSTALMAVTLLRFKLPVPEEAIRRGLENLTLPGRIEVIQGQCTEIYDVSHNPDAVTVLANYLAKTPCAGKTRAVFSMLADKDVLMSLKMIAGEIHSWYVAPLAVKRGASSSELLWAFNEAKISGPTFYNKLSDAFHTARSHASKDDRIVIFGSFHTVAEGKSSAENCF